MSTREELIKARLGMLALAALWKERFAAAPLRSAIDRNTANADS